MRSWVALAALAVGCGGKTAVAPREDACAIAGDTLARAKVDARQGRVLHAQARLRALGACLDGDARAYVDELAASLGIDALLAKRDVHDPSADTAAVRGEDALAHARELRAELLAGSLDAGDAMDAAYAQAADDYERAVAIAARLDWLVAIAQIWREADDRVQANRAASRAAAFAMAVAGVDHLTPELVPVRTEDPDAFGLWPIGDEPGSVMSVAWSADGAVLIADTYGDRPRAWQAGREVRATQGDDLDAALGITRASRIVVELDDHRIRAGDTGITARDVTPEYPAAVGPTGTIVTGTRFGADLNAWTADGGHRVIASPPEAATALDWGAAGLVAGGGWRADAGRVRCYDDTGALRWETEATGDPAFAIATDLDGRRIAVGTRHGAIRIYDRDGALRGTLVSADAITQALGPDDPLPSPEQAFQQWGTTDPRVAVDWIALAPDGHVDGSPDGGRFVQWRAGDQVVPGFIGWDAQLQPGLLAQILAR